MNQATNIENLTVAWCDGIIETLLLAGAQRFFFSPGYRDAPFAAALKHRDVELVSCMDERAAGYLALGAAKHDGKPSVLICTSGTAVANYLPAVIEAAKEQIPLFIISCDRPPELIHVGANQTIEQGNILGSFAKTSLNLPCPEDNISAPMLNAMLRRALQRSLTYPYGVTHINVPLRGPLEPRVHNTKRLEEFLGSRPKVGFEPISRQGLATASGFAESLESFVSQTNKGILLVGRLPSGTDFSAIENFAECLGWPIYSDVSSSLKFSHSQLVDPELKAGQDFLEDYDCDGVIHIGKRLVSKYWDIYLSKNPEIPSFVVTNESDELNPSFGLQSVYRTESYKELARTWRFQGKTSSHMGAWLELAQSHLDSETVLHFPSFANRYLRESECHNLFLGNSSAIRAFDTWQFGRLNRRLRIEVNRGVSGIEGLVSTAMGLCLASGEPWDVVLGDVSMIHDLNSLLQVSLLNLPLRIFVFNNRGGHIWPGNGIDHRDGSEIAGYLATWTHFRIAR